MPKPKQMDLVKIVSQDASKGRALEEQKFQEDVDQLMEDFLFDVAVIGEPNVGKTSLITKIKNDFEVSYQGNAMMVNDY